MRARVVPSDCSLGREGATEEEEGGGNRDDDDDEEEEEAVEGNREEA